MKYLAEQPKPKGAEAALPSSTSILNIYVADGVCYLNLGTSFVDNVSDDTIRLRVYAIVNSLCQLERVKRVQISVGGENLKVRGDNQNEDGLYMPDESLILNKRDVELNK
jgi:germination protein M